MHCALKIIIIISPVDGYEIKIIGTRPVLNIKYSPIDRDIFFYKQISYILNELFYMFLTIFNYSLFNTYKALITHTKVIIIQNIGGVLVKDQVS